MTSYPQMGANTQTQLQWMTPASFSTMNATASKSMNPTEALRCTLFMNGILLELEGV